MDPELEDLVAEYVERLESGDRLTPEAFQSEHSDRGPELLAALHRLHRTESLFPASLRSPQRVRSYEIVGTIGRGAMGTVLRARDPRLRGQDIALKLLNPGSLLNPRARERFRREGEALTRVTHPNVVRVREVGWDGAQPFIAMDAVDGKPLSSFVTEARACREVGDEVLCARLSLPGGGSARARVAQLVARLARAVAALHGEGILHRDLKPDNVIVEVGGEPILIDFGLAVDEGFVTLTSTGDVVGTLPYMAPEQARGERVDIRADVYGLGAILHELLTLGPPHTASDTGSLLQAVTRRAVRSARGSDPLLPSALYTILYRSLAFGAGRRYPTAEALADDLEAFAAGRAIRAVPPRPWEHASDAWRRHPRTARVLSGVGALALVFGFALFVATLRGGHQRTFTRLSEAATLAWVEGDRAAVAKTLRELEELRPTDPHTRFFAHWQGKIPQFEAHESELHGLSRGIRLYRAGQVPDAIPYLEAAVESFPGWAVPVAALGRAAREAEDRDRALRELSVAAALLPASARLQYEIALTSYEAGKMDTALGPARKATELEPRNVDYWILLARTCCRTQNYEEGLRAARAAAAGSAQAGKRVLRSLGVLLTSTGKHREGIRVFEELYLLDPKDRNTCFSLALVHDTLDEHLSAIRYYRESIAVEPTECRARLCLANIYAGANSDGCEACREFFRNHPEFLDFDRAEALSEEALAIDGGRDLNLLHAMINVYHQIGRLDRLIPVLKKKRDFADGDREIVNFQKAARRAQELLEDR